MGEHEWIFDVSELATISLECPHCHNLITYSAQTPDVFGVPAGCLTCQRPLGAVAQCFALYRQFYRAAVDAQTPVQLRTRVPVATRKP